MKFTLWDKFKHWIPWRTLFFMLITVACIGVIYYSITNPNKFTNELYRDAIVIGLSTSMIGSLLFMSLLWVLKPNFIISDFICHTTRKADKKSIKTSETGEEVETIEQVDEDLFLIKVVNNSFFWDAVEINVNLLSKEKIQVGINDDKSDTKIRLIPMKKSSMHVIPCITINNRKEAPFAQIFATSENLYEIFEQGKTLMFEIYAKHSLSGFSKIRYKNYNKSECVQKTDFEHGYNLGLKTK